MEEKIFTEISKKLNILIAFSLRQLPKDNTFSKDDKRKKGVGELASYFNSMGLEAKDIAEIIGAPVQSIRTLLTPRRKK